MRAFGDIEGGDAKGRAEVVPGIKVLFKLSGMQALAYTCLRCVNGDSALRLKSKRVVEELADFKATADFHWRHGTNIVYHTLEPGDKLKFSKKGTFLGLTRLPRKSGSSSSSSTTRSEHIKRGSAFNWRSPYISCSLNFAFCVFYAQKQESMFSDEVFRLAPILEIDLAKLGGSEERGAHIFDDTKQEGLTSCEMTMVERFAADADEVVLDGIEVPRSAVRAVYNLDYKTRPAGECWKQTQALVGRLKTMDLALRTDASDRNSPFAKWERRFYRHTRPTGGGGSMVEHIKEQALVKKEEVERVLRNSYCGRREAARARWCGGGGGGGNGGGGRNGSGPPTGGGATGRPTSSGRSGGNGNPTGRFSSGAGAASVGGGNRSDSSGSGGGSASGCSRGGDGGGGAGKTSAKGGKGKKRERTEGVQSEHKNPKRS